MMETSKPFDIVDGKKYVHNNDVEVNCSDSLPEPEILKQLPPTPRKVSLIVQVLLILNKDYAFLGWIFTCFGMVYCIVFVPIATNTAIDLLRYYEPLGQGEIAVVEKTNWESNEIPVYLFTFKQPNGALGKCRIHGERYKIGDKVELEKSGNNIRIVGSGKNVWNFVMIVFFLFPIIGLLFIGNGMAHGLKALFLLQYGEIGKGHIIDMEPTGTVINNNPEMKLHYQFTANDGETYNAFAKTCNTTKLTDDSVEPLFYDAMEPNRSVLLDSLPNGIRIDELDGSFRANPLRIFFPLLFCGLFFVELIILIYAVIIGGFIPQ